MAFASRTFRLMMEVPKGRGVGRAGRSYVVGVVAAIMLFASCFRADTTKSDAFQAGIPVRVGPKEFGSSFSYYNTSPESPDGSKIAYTKFLSMPMEGRSEKVSAEIWICDADLTGHRKLADANPMEVHNGARVQWLDTHSLAFADDSIRVIDLQGNPLIRAVSGRIGHQPFGGNFIYSDTSNESGIQVIYEYNVFNNEITRIADAMDFRSVLELFPSRGLREVKEFEILHLQYSPDGRKVAFRMNIGPRNEKYNHLIVMDRDGGNVRYFGPKPMHFGWYDNESIMGHDNQIDDGMVNDRSCRRWHVDGTYMETLAGIGNHLGASDDRTKYASETWYYEVPVILRVFRKGKTEAFWRDTVSTDRHTTWILANHTNPSFSRDGTRIYYNKCVAPGVAQAYMATLPTSRP